MADYPNVEVREGDFLAMDLPKKPYKVFANIPFHLSSPIVRKFVETDNSPESMYLVVQKQFANKLLPDSDRFTGQLGMMVGPLFAVRIRKRLQRTDFWPHPNVDTVLIEFIRRDEPLLPRSAMPAYRQFIEDCFSDPRKFAKAPRKAVGLPDDIKPSQMKLAQWVALFSAKKN
jgi:23S rRNA (adenine-N6)-dimethyltransferase